MRQRRPRQVSHGSVGPGVVHGVVLRVTTVLWAIKAQSVWSMPPNFETGDLPIQQTQA